MNILSFIQNLPFFYFVCCHLLPPFVDSLDTFLFYYFPIRYQKILSACCWSSTVSIRLLVLTNKKKKVGAEHGWKQTEVYIGTNKSTENDRGVVHHERRGDQHIVKEFQIKRTRKGIIKKKGEHRTHSCSFVNDHGEKLRRCMCGRFFSFHSVLLCCDPVHRHRRCLYTPSIVQL